MVLKAAALAQKYTEQYAQPGKVDLAAGADPDFGGEKIETVQAAAGVLSFGTAGKTSNVRAIEHFLVLGQTVKQGETLLDVPEADAKYLVNVGKAVYATDEEVADAQKASK